MSPQSVSGARTSGPCFVLSRTSILTRLFLGGMMSKRLSADAMSSSSLSRASSPPPTAVTCLQSGHVTSGRLVPPS